MQVFPVCSIVHGVKFPYPCYSKEWLVWVSHGRHAEICHVQSCHSAAYVWLHGVSWPKYLRHTVNVKEKRSCKHLCLPLTAQYIHASQSTIINGVEEEKASDENETTNTLCQEVNMTIEEESLVSLEWSSVCTQVAQFTSTPTGREDASNGQLMIGKTLRDSQDLLEQTSAAYHLPDPLDFSGIVDVQNIIKDAVSGITCTLNELCDISSFLSSSKRLFDQLHDASLVFSNSFESFASPIEPNETDAHLNQAYSPLLSVFSGVDLCSSLEKDLKYCLHFSSLSLMDRASTTLTMCRSDRRINMQTLESLLYDASKRIVEAGGMDSILVTSRRARLCIAVRASHKHLIPDGVVLGTSNSGATLFIEPRPALEYNNKEVELACLEKTEESAILKNLTCKVADAAESISDLLEKVTILDLACARAAHAKWLGSVRPVFGMPIESSWCNGQTVVTTGNSSSILIEGILHPLLLGSALLKADNDSNQIHVPTRSQPGILVPIDIKVNYEVNVVIISGPNTGGKTATMKTLGVAILMTKAGMFLPAKGKAVLPWFDKVLVDIGDDQSLEQNLSTFSGHMRRLHRIIEAGTETSLVLLDEIGSGTDPSEGIALATAVLKYFANHVQLTLATTHYTELSSLKEKDNRFEIASMDFDVDTLRPTYHVLWGTRGQSNALEIASSLQFDAKVLDRAQYWMKKLGRDGWKEHVNELMVPLLDQQAELQAKLVKAKSAFSEAKRLYEEMLAEADDLENRMAALRLKQEEYVKGELATAKYQMDEIVSQFQKSTYNTHMDGKQLSFRTAHSAIAAIVDKYTGKFSTLPTTQANTTSAEIPAVGEKVVLHSLGKKLGTVIEAPTSIYDSFLVQLGSMKIRVTLNDIAGTSKAKKAVDAPDQFGVSTASEAMAREERMRKNRK